jgi:hypothetical protein
MKFTLKWLMVIIGYFGGLILYILLNNERFKEKYL